MISSVVSFSRMPINEEMPGMQFGLYSLPPSIGTIPSILHVQDSYYYKPDIDGMQDRVLVVSPQIVESIVSMHVSSQLQAGPDSHPAVFALPNEEVTVDDVLSKFKSQAKIALEKQRNWFKSLVMLADDDWQRLKNHRMISDIQRIAARELGLEREWLMAEMDIVHVECPFCGSDLLNPDAPICPHCGKVHNPAKLAELEARLAGPVNMVTGRK